jgi:proline iminopeptidase
MQYYRDILIKSGDANLSVMQYARANSDTIILLHGGPGVPDEMTEVREFLTRYFQVVTFDQRGTGYNDCKECTYTMDEYIEDINCIAASLDIEKFHLFGHSWGGLYAQIYARKHPERILSLFLCSPASGTGKIWSMTEKEVLEYNRKKSTNTEWVMMGLNAFLGFLGSNAAYRRLFRQVIINYHKGYSIDPPEAAKLAKINARAANMTRRQIKLYPALEVFGKTKFQVIITYGQYDAYGKSREYVFERFPESKTYVIPECGHTPWKHNPAAFKEILKRFYFKSRH